RNALAFLRSHLGSSLSEGILLRASSLSAAAAKISDLGVFMPTHWTNESAHRWRPLRDSRIAERRGGAALRCSAWLGILLRIDRSLPECQVHKQKTHSNEANGTHNRGRALEWRSSIILLPEFSSQQSANTQQGEHCTENDGQRPSAPPAHE